MTKKDVIKEAQKGWPDTHKIVNGVFRAITAAIGRGETVTIYNFGVFYRKKSTRKEVYDFKNRRRIPFAGKFKAGFHPSPNAEKAINQIAGASAS